VNISRREQSLLVITTMVVLFSILGLTLRKQLEKFSEQRVRLQNLENLRREERVLLSVEEAWRKKYEAVQDLMPVFDAKEQVEAFWGRRMQTLATQVGVTINNSRSGSQNQVGDVYEFTIECREWTGTLEAFAKFLFALQNEGAMLDIRDLTIRPHPQQKELVRGTFTLYCAYMREGEKK